MDMISLAESVARLAHYGQFRRDGVTPYIVHPESVVRRLDGNDEKIVGWLHDVVEDTPVSESHLVDFGFPQYIVDAVSAVTKREGQDIEDYYKGIKANPLACKVKIADMLCNLSCNPNPQTAVKYVKALLFLRGFDEKFSS
jgi:(p)ppGpp synthase/HD superfamily hydrolase